MRWRDWIRKALGTQTPAPAGAGESSPGLAAIPSTPSGEHRRLATEARRALSSIALLSDLTEEEQAVLDGYRSGQTLSDMRAPTGAFGRVKG
jgi:hypothetical protein